MAKTHTPVGIGELPPPVGAPVARPRRPRLWILVAGGWMALCWLLLIGSIATTDIGGVLLAIIAMLPVNFVWRFRYWRAKATPFRDASYMVERELPGHTYEQKYGFARDDGGTDVVTEYTTVGGGKVREETADLGKRTLGVWTAGFVFPMRDALRELRAARAGAPPLPLS